MQTLDYLAIIVQLIEDISKMDYDYLKVAGLYQLHASRRFNNCREIMLCEFDRFAVLGTANVTLNVIFKKVLLSWHILYKDW